MLYICNAFMRFVVSVTITLINVTMSWIIYFIVYWRSSHFCVCECNWFFFSSRIRAAVVSSNDTNVRTLLKSRVSVKGSEKTLWWYQTLYRVEAFLESMAFLDWKIELCNIIFTVRRVYSPCFLKDGKV